MDPDRARELVIGLIEDLGFDPDSVTEVVIDPKSVRVTEWVIINGKYTGRTVTTKVQFG